jgi:hypothetical protein
MQACILVLGALELTGHTGDLVLGSRKLRAHARHAANGAFVLLPLLLCQSVELLVQSIVVLGRVREKRRNTAIR